MPKNLLRDYYIWFIELVKVEEKTLPNNGPVENARIACPSGSGKRDCLHHKNNSSISSPMV